MPEELSTVSDNYSFMQALHGRVLNRERRLRLLWLIIARNGNSVDSSRFYRIHCDRCLRHDARIKEEKVGETRS